MHKSKMLFSSIIILTLVISPLIVSASTYSTPMENILLFNAMTINYKTSIPGLNQPPVQIPSVDSENFECVEPQQKDISAKTSGFYAAIGIGARDFDGDGYYSKYEIAWDADTTGPYSEEVQVQVYSRDENSTIRYEGASRWYTIYYYDLEIESMIITVDTRGTYDFRLELYNHSGLQDVINYGENPPYFIDVPMESASEDGVTAFRQMLALLLIIPTIQSANQQGTLTIAVLILLLVVIGAVTAIVIWLASRRGPPAPPSLPPGAEPRPWESR